MFGYGENGGITRANQPPIGSVTAAHSVDHIFGKGEVDSSILSGSTIFINPGDQSDPMLESRHLWAATQILSIASNRPAPNSLNPVITNAPVPLTFVFEPVAARYRPSPNHKRRPGAPFVAAQEVSASRITTSRALSGRHPLRHYGAYLNILRLLWNRRIIDDMNRSGPLQSCDCIGALKLDRPSRQACQQYIHRLRGHLMDVSGGRGPQPALT
jgi:hypothetical protein